MKNLTSSFLTSALQLRDTVRKRDLTETEGVQKMHSCFPTLVVKQIISPHVSLWICMPLKCLYPTKITVSQE